MNPNEHICFCPWVACADGRMRPTCAGGPNDQFEISSNNAPDEPDYDDDDSGPTWDEMGDYPEDGDSGGDDE